MKYKISQKNAWFQDVSRATPQTNPKDNCFIGNLVALTRQLGWARATGKTLHLVRVYQARVLHGGQVMWCCVRVVQPQVYRACVCVYIYIYTLYICIFNIPIFLALCFSTFVFPRTFTSRFMSGTVMVELYPWMETLHLFVLDGSGKNCRDAKGT